jgi:hypothetical protein
VKKTKENKRKNGRKQTSEKIHFFPPFISNCRGTSTTYTKQWEGVVLHHGISNGMDHQFTTCKVMAMRVVPPKTHAIRITTR